MYFENLCNYNEDLPDNKTFIRQTRVLYDKINHHFRVTCNYIHYVMKSRRIGKNRRF